VKSACNCCEIVISQVTELGIVSGNLRYHLIARVTTSNVRISRGPPLFPDSKCNRRKKESSSPVRSPVRGNVNATAVYPRSLGMPDAKQELIAYRCSRDHLFLPPSHAAAQWPSCSPVCSFAQTRVFGCPTTFYGEDPLVTAPTKGHILVVDDEAIIRDSTSMLLRAAGYEVRTAGHGFDALFATRNCTCGCRHFRSQHAADVWV
jgi:hypothetical protein